MIRPQTSHQQVISFKLEQIKIDAMSVTTTATENEIGNGNGNGNNNNYVSQPQDGNTDSDAGDNAGVMNESMIDDEDNFNDDSYSDDNNNNGRDDDTDNDDTTSIIQVPWEPSGSKWRDMLYFVGPGWLVSIAYIDPGNYQADIQAGATTQYYLLFTIWWSSVLSMYIQVLCVRLGYYGQQTLAQAQANEHHGSFKRYLAWFLAEFSVIMTDLPEVIGIGIACNLFFGWPYWIGVVMSLITTMLFLGTIQFGMQILEYIIVLFVGIMSVALFVEMSFVKPQTEKLLQGWLYGFIDITADDLFAIAGILGAVVMPHNLYLHTATVQNKKVVRRNDVVKQAVWYCSIEPIFPIFLSFFVNVAVVSIAAERVYGTPNASSVGLTDFCNYFYSLKGGCLMWGIALLAAGQSSAITTTYTGQYIMDGFLNIQLPVHVRAIATRLVAITPCVIVSIFFPSYLNQMVNIVNVALGFLLPFALLPLIKYNCSPIIMGGNEFASKGREKMILYGFGIFVWFINATALSVPGGGFFGDFVKGKMWSIEKVCWVVLEVTIQILYAWWNYTCLFTPIHQRFEDASAPISTPEPAAMVMAMPSSITATIIEDENMLT